MNRAWRLIGLLSALTAGLSCVPQEPASMSSDSQGRRPNRLSNEKSPYLLQHADNPVDWYPWGEEAFAAAKRDEKPIFLSIGYSTCYWCHVMERESFENPQIAALINEHFVPIKVDREERPDLDALYLGAVMAMTGQGGWPTTIFLTPEGHPFWGGTYFPPEDRGRLPGLPTVLRSVAEAWKTRRDELVRSGASITQALQDSAGAASASAPKPDVLETAVGQYREQFDAADGGFGPAPKFPRSHSLSFLLRMWSRTRESTPLQMAEATLQAMADGGLHDQLGGGFHRYSTDARWLVPHFEKMLYDQALLSRTYLEAHQVTGKRLYAEVARGIFDYVLRDLRDAGGAFYAAEDAGEVGEEGAFYVWTPEETAAALGEDAAQLFKRAYDVTPEGNFEGRSILHVEQPLEDLAKRDGTTPEDVSRRLAAARAELLAARSRRPRPHRDDKLLTDWNGLMIGALAYGARALDEPRYAQAAGEAADFLLSRLQTASPAAGGTPSPAGKVPARSRNGELLHRWRDGSADIPAFLDDYAFLASGLLELYEATQEPRWLEEALRLTREMIRLFRDDAGGGFFLAGVRNERLVARTKELYDGAVPSGNSVAAMTLVRLGQLTMDEPLQKEAERMFRAFAAQVQQAPHAFPVFLAALDVWLGPAQEIVVAGDPDDPATRAMVREISRRFLPRATVLVHPPGPAGRDIERLVPFVQAQQPLGGQPTAYVCENSTCQLPTTDLQQLTAQLDKLR